MKQKAFLSLSLALSLTTIGCSSQEVKTQKTSGEKHEKVENTRVGHHDHFHNDSEKMNEIQSKHFRTVQEIKNQMFPDTNFKQGIINLDEKNEKIVIGLKNLGEEEKKFKEKVNAAIPKDIVEWNTVKYSRYQLAHKKSVVFHDVRNMRKDEFNNYQVTSTKDRTQLLLQIDHLTKEMNEKLKEKFGDMLVIHELDEQKKLTKKAEQQDIPSTQKSLTLVTEKDTYPIKTTDIKATVKNNHDDYTFLFGNKFTIQKYENNAWYKVPFDNMAVTSIGLAAPPGDKSTQTIPLTQMDYSLEPGRYRVVKEFDTEENSTPFHLAAEFKLTK